MRKLLVTALFVALALSWTAASSDASKQVTIKPVNSAEPVPITVGYAPGAARSRLARRAPRPSRLTNLFLHGPLPLPLAIHHISARNSHRFERGVVWVRPGRRLAGQRG